MAQKPKSKVVATPKGTLVFPHLGSPDTKFNKDGGDYHTKIAHDPADQKVQEFLKVLDAEVDAAFAEMKELHKKFAKVMTKVLPYKNEVDEEGEETGRVILAQIKMRAVVKPGENSKKQFKPFKQEPLLVDAKLTPLPKSTKIGGGTVARVSFEIVPYFAAKEKQAGISLRLVGVQVIDLKTFGERNAASMGFGEEDGFSAAEESTDAGFSADGESDGITPGGASGDEDDF